MKGKNDMAKNTGPASPEAFPEAPAAPVKKAEAVYSAAQLTEGYREFGTSRAIVACALKLAGKDSATLAEARKIIDTFRNREVN